MTLHIRVADDGRTFSTRPRAALLGDRVVQGAPGEDIELDFAAVLSVSYSFADELLATLASDAACELGVRLINASPEVHRVFSRAAERRSIDSAWLASMPASA